MPEAARVPDEDELPAPTPLDARRAVIDAARKDGLTCVRGAYEARRTYVESSDAFGTYDPVNVVTLSLRQGYGGDTVGIFPVYPFSDVRDDWTRPAPDWFDRADDVLPADDYALDDVFLDPSSLPGVDQQAVKDELADAGDDGGD